jgi:lipopolysaccharide heptosyltransferase I
MSAMRILVVRLGAMGDIIHALPAVASLKQSFAHSEVTWAVESKWTPLLEGNPFVDRIAEIDRHSFTALLAMREKLRRTKFDLAVDLQGLIKSALVAASARPERIAGFHRSQVREGLAALFYSHTTRTHSQHVVEQNLDLVKSAGATSLVRSFFIPEGKPEGDLPRRDFVLANPLAGWTSKQWPAENYSQLARMLDRDYGLDLVLNVPPNADAVPGAFMHQSSLAGLIHVTRRAVAVVGVDSGPLHLAAALGKPGVAIFGPTDPLRNGPYGNTFAVLRSPNAITSYKRRDDIDASMRDVSPAAVFASLKTRMFCTI